jgi:hypothetical protein
MGKQPLFVFSREKRGNGSEVRKIAKPFASLIG